MRIITVITELLKWNLNITCINQPINRTAEHATIFLLMWQLKGS